MKRFLTAMLIVAAVIFSACTITYNVKDADEPSRPYLSITAGGARALLPTGFDFASNTAISFVLDGTISGGAAGTIRTWTATTSEGTTTSAYANMVADTTTYVDAGSWSFTLSAVNDGTVVLTKTIAKTIVEGQNMLAFGELEEPADGKGSVSITLKYPHLDSNGVTKVTAAVYELDGKTAVIPASGQTITAGASQDQVVFSSSGLASGSYLITFYLYDTVDGTETLINPYSEYVRVATGCLTSGECVITNLNTIYTITYELNSGAIDSATPASYNADESVTLPTGVSRNYYAFSGWYASADFSGAPVASWAAGEKTGNLTFYAKWTPVTYTISYTLNGGTNNAANPAEYNVESAAITLAEPAKSGYTFGGWTDTTATGDAVTEIASGSHGDRTLYANWNMVTYNISYELDGGTNAASNPATYNVEGGDITLATPTKKGYTFDGWTKDSNAGSATVELVFDTAAAADVTFYAHWTANYLTITVSAPAYSSEDIHLASSTSGTVTTFTVDSGYASYAWYFDGARQSEAVANTWAIDSAGTTPALKPGKHQILVIATDSTKHNSYSAVVYYTYTK